MEEFFRPLLVVY